MESFKRICSTWKKTQNTLISEQTGYNPKYYMFIIFKYFYIQNAKETF